MDTSLRISRKLHLVTLCSRSTSVSSARCAVEEGEVVIEKAPSFGPSSKKGYSLEPRASPGTLVTSTRQPWCHSEVSAKAYGHDRVGVRVQVRT